MLARFSLLCFFLTFAFGATSRSAWGIGCPSTPQDIFIIDLKSGWWSGDGGDFHARAIRQILDTCPDTIRIDYWHINRYGDGTPPHDWSSYEQIFILSGAANGFGDIPLDSPVWLTIRRGIVRSKANVFLGGGANFIDHANHVAQAFRLGDVLQKRTHPSTAPLRLLRHSKLTDNIVQLGGANLTNELYGRTTSDVQIRPIAFTNAEAPVIGIVAPTPELPRTFIIDGGIQRFYTIFENRDDTFMYLMNCFLFLQQP